MFIENFNNEMYNKSYFQYPDDYNFKHEGLVSGGNDFKEEFLTGKKNSCIRIFKDQFTGDEAKKSAEEKKERQDLEIEEKKKIIFEAYNKETEWSRVALLVPNEKESFDLFVNQVLNSLIPEKKD